MMPTSRSRLTRTSPAQASRRRASSHVLSGGFGRLVGAWDTAGDLESRSRVWRRAGAHDPDQATASARRAGELDGAQAEVGMIPRLEEFHSKPVREVCE